MCYCIENRRVWVYLGNSKIEGNEIGNTHWLGCHILVYSAKGMRLY